MKNFISLCSDVHVVMAGAYNPEDVDRVIRRAKRHLLYKEER